MSDYIADFHIHSKFSRACSKDLILPKISEAAALKGIQLIGTGDFTHPEWFKMMTQELVMNERGFYVSKSAKPQWPVELVPTSEIACIYKKNDKVRRLHLIVVAPSLDVVSKINAKLNTIGNLKADGRPILGLGAKELAKIVLDIDSNCLIIPAHAWTPWFAVFGSKSGFDSLEECFDEMTPHIAAIETGLSSDPVMNRRLSKLDNITLLSNSDAHSLDNLGREANLFDGSTSMTYGRLYNMIWRKEKGFKGTIEFYPEEGKYHVDGHAACEVQLTPDETRRYNGRCPKCGGPITVGVLSRVESLADRKKTKAEESDYKYIVPLREIIGEVLGVGKKSKSVAAVYNKLVPALGSEFTLLLHTPLADIAKVGFPDIAAAIDKVRRGDIEVSPGYDGIYGTVKIKLETRGKKKAQVSLFEN
jgi:DNA helicase-2/ATP-dependent DNA helicase PcrA